jgi:hypothetical protein
MNYQVVALTSDINIDTQCAGNGDPVFQKLAFNGINSTGTCKYANDELYTGAEIWEGSNAGPYLEAVLEKMYKDNGNYKGKSLIPLRDLSTFLCHTRCSPLINRLSRS